MNEIDRMIRAQSIVAALVGENLAFLPIVYRLDAEIVAAERDIRASKIKVTGSRVRDRAA